MKARLCDDVHYVQPGSEDGKQESKCLAAIVTETPAEDTVSLLVLHPNGDTEAKRQVLGDRGSEGADTWHPAGLCPNDL